MANNRAPHATLIWPALVYGDPSPPPSFRFFFFLLSSPPAVPSAAVPLAAASPASASRARFFFCVASERRVSEVSSVTQKELIWLRQPSLPRTFFFVVSPSFCQISVSKPGIWPGWSVNASRRVASSNWEMWAGWTSGLRARSRRWWSFFIVLRPVTGRLGQRLAGAGGCWPVASRVLRAAGKRDPARPGGIGQETGELTWYIPHQMTIVLLHLELLHLPAHLASGQLHPAQTQRQPAQPARARRWRRRGSRLRVLLLLALG